MKNIQQTIFLVVAVGLCGLCAWQWVDGAGESRALEARNQVIFDRDRALQSATNSLALADKLVADLQKRVADLETSAATNATLSAAQTRQMAQLQAASDKLTSNLGQYESAVTNLEARLATAYDGIEKQNTALAELTAQRDEFIGKYTNSINDRNEIVAKYNALVEQANHPPTSK